MLFNRVAVSVVLAFVLAAGATALVAQTGSGGTVVVTVTRAGSPMAGAFVALVGSATNRYAGITGATGTVTFTAVTADSYIGRAAAPGTTVGAQNNIVVSDGGTTTSTIAVAKSGTIFTGLGAFGSLTTSVVADGRTGVFYLNTNAIPSLYRTGDYGGTWAPVTISSDDASNGIDGGETVGLLAASGYPGEIVGATRNKVWYSRDFGVSWSSIALPTLTGPTGAAGAPPATLHWVHPRGTGATSRILLVANQTTDIYYFDIVAGAVPTWSGMAVSYKQAAGDKVAFASGETSSFAAVAPVAGGSVTIYAMGATPNRTTESSSAQTIVNGAPAGAPQLLYFGGPRTGQALTTSSGATPNTLLVYSRTASTTGATANSGAAVMSTFVSTQWVSTSATSFRKETSEDVASLPYGFNLDVPDSCQANDVATGSVSPGGGFGTIGKCWVEQSGTTLIARPVLNIRNTSGFVYDAEYGNANGNLVVLAGDSRGMGAGKSDRKSPTLNRPDFPTWPTLATAGFSTAPYATTKGGISLTGLNAANIGDVVFSPTTVNNMAVIMSGGGRIVGSKDRGETWFTLEARDAFGGGGIDWWESTGGAQWLVAGVASGSEDGYLLSAVRLTGSGAFTESTVTTPVVGTRKADFGISDRVRVKALVGIPGTDKVIVATSRNDRSAAVLTLVTLSQSGSGYSATPVSLPGSFGAGNEPNALAYCPTIGSASSVADKLFVAVAGTNDFDTNGTLFTISSPAGAAPGSPTTVPGATGGFRDVRVDCTTGTVYAGRNIENGFSGLMKATTSAGASGTLSALAQVTTFAAGKPGREGVETLDISPSDVKRLVVVTRSGDVYSTTDGADTFRLINDTSTAGCNVTFTTCGRKFGSIPGDIEIAPNTTRTPDMPWDEGVCPRGLCDGEALFGSSAGVYSAIVTLEPAAPVNFTAVASGLTLSMAWTAATGGGTVADYLLEAATDSAFAQVIYAQAFTTSSTTLTAPAGTTGTFHLRVKARNASGTSAPSNSVSVTLPGSGGGGTPGTPGRPQVTVNANNSISVVWTAPAAGATPTSYRVYVTTPSGVFPGSPFAVPAVTSVVSPGPLPNGSYTMSISALSGTSEGAPSAATTFTVGCSAAPGAPTGFAITKLGGLGARLAWTAPAGGSAATSYVVQASLNSTFVPLVFNQEVGASTSLDATGVPGTFFVRVLAKNGCGTSAASNTATVTLP